ncbi:MAG: hypothetical protein HKN13_06885 [Rhodothermales bacterium]|nr:hypothetical protein [Rhodothermales bacterium]
MSRIYSVYVILLRDEVLSSGRFVKANPAYKRGSPCVYVGSSAHAPELRFEQHKSGYRSSRFAKEYGERLMPELYEQYNPIPTRHDAEEIEAYLADRLRVRGFGVWTN